MAESDIENVGEIVTVRSDAPRICPLCARGYGSGGTRIFPSHPNYVAENDLELLEQEACVNHLLTSHDGNLLQIGQETRDGAVVTVVVVGIPRH